MADNNPNVPAEQKTAAETSAPAAKVTPQQPAQLPTGTAATPSGTVVPTTTPMATPTVPVAPAVTPGATVPTATPLTGVPVDTTKRDEEQKIVKDMADVATSGKDYFEQQEEFAKTFEEREGEDSFRRAARIEREREAAASTGDPVRDPVEKQKRMDMNTVQPGAVADAQKIKDIGADSVKK